jgi:reactive intermediate/imine deaminase
MKSIIAMAIGGLLIPVSGEATPTRATVERLPAPALPGGQLAPFSSAVRVGDILFLSGQLGVGPDGKLPDGIEAQTKQAMDNVGAVLKRAGLGYDRIFHCTAYLADMKEWPAFNIAYVGYFPDGQMPARSAVGVTGLALGARLEIECQAYAGK